MTILAGVALALAVALQLVTRWGLGRRVPIGDEHSYLARGADPDPYAPRLFLRPPLLPWLSRVAYRAVGGSRPDQERHLRTVIALASASCVLLAATAGWRLGGPVVAALTAGLMTSQPERLVLGSHLWPDTFLALALGVLLVLQTLPFTLEVALAMGLACTVGVLCRIDFLVVIPSLAAALLWTPGTVPDLAGWALIGAPPLLALLAWSVRNGRRYGTYLPDTTWAFNLMMAASAVRADPDQTFSIQGTVEEVVTDWQELPPKGLAAQARTTAAILARRPWRLVRGMAGRLVTLLGPDSFVRQRLLAAGAYPDLGPRGHRLLSIALWLAFPLLATVVLVSSLALREPPPPYTWPTLALAAAMVAFHTRTRYRVALFPALCLLAADLLHRLPELRIAGEAALLAVAGAALFTALIRARRSDELSARA